MFFQIAFDDVLVCSRSKWRPRHDAVLNLTGRGRPLSVRLFVLLSWCFFQKKHYRFIRVRQLVQWYLHLLRRQRQSG